MGIGHVCLSSWWTTTRTLLKGVRGFSLCEAWVRAFRSECASLGSQSGTCWGALTAGMGARWYTVLFSPPLGKTKAPGFRSLGSPPSHGETEYIRTMANPHTERELQPLTCSHLPANQCTVTSPGSQPTAGQTCRRSDSHL